MTYYKESKTLIIPRDYNGNLDNVQIETEIIKINNFSIFNIPVDNLPKNLKYLHFNKYFNQKVNNLPNKLTTLIFGDIFFRPNS